MKQQIAIYLRLSLEDVDKRTTKVKDESNSIASQRMLINRHLDQNPLLCDLPRIEFCDDGFSGTNFDRPDFAKMIEYAKHGEISCIVVKDLSRFGRDYLEVGDYLEHIFPFLGIRFISINDHYDSSKQDYWHGCSLQESHLRLLQQGSLQEGQVSNGVETEKSQVCEHCSLRV